MLISFLLGLSVGLVSMWIPLHFFGRTDRKWYQQRHETDSKTIQNLQELLVMDTYDR